MPATEIKATLKPLGNRVVVELTEADDKTSGGILLPDSAKDKPMVGKVIAVGAGKYSDNGQLEPMTVKVGDMVMFGKYAGSEVKQNGKELKIMAESDILAILEG
jgi:chaperonin GroES